MFFTYNLTTMLKIDTKQDDYQKDRGCKRVAEKWVTTQLQPLTT